MKSWVIFGLAALGLYAVYNWWQQKAASPAVQGAHNDPGAVVSAISPPGLYSGVPGYDMTPIANGHGDQIAAAYHSNQMATITPTGNDIYQPAFGPFENRSLRDMIVY